MRSCPPNASTRSASPRSPAAGVVGATDAVVSDLHQCALGATRDRDLHRRRLGVLRDIRERLRGDEGCGDFDDFGESFTDIDRHGRRYRRSCGE